MLKRIADCIRWLKSAYHDTELKRFQSCLKNGQPYIGSHLGSNQGQPKRYEHMRELIKADCSRLKISDYAILEIGSWAGGSALVWAQALKEFNQSKGLVLCVDSWSQFDLGGEGGIYEIMRQALDKDEIFPLFLHNVKASGYQDIIRWIRMRSAEILPLLKEASFDLIYIDGCHRHQEVRIDIQNSMRLLKQGGVLCGDDLELQLSSANADQVSVNAEVDYIQDEKSGRWFHPGVTLAVAEFLGEVSAWDGFWAVKKQGQKWEPYCLKTLI